MGAGPMRLERLNPGTWALDCPDFFMRVNGRIAKDTPGRVERGTWDWESSNTGGAEVFPPGPGTIRKRLSVIELL
jgi:hypothetical protein